MTITEKLKELGYSTISDDFVRKVDEWNSWYIGNVKGFHRYKVRTGPETISCKRYSLGMGKKIPEDWANLLLNEKVGITLEGNKEQEFIDQVFKDNNFFAKGNEMQEAKFALGTVAYIPSVVGQTEGGDASGIQLDYVTAGHIWPLSWRNGIVTECAFDSVITVGRDEYLYLQIHRRDEDDSYVIENSIYRYQDGNLSDAAMSEVQGFETLPPVVYTKSNKRQFVIDRPNIANNFDLASPMGISVFANSIDIMEGADIAYDAFVQDFVTGKRRLFITPAATEYVDGEPAFDPHDLALYVLPEDVSGENKPIQETGGNFAVAETQAGVQMALNVLSSKCGFGENHYRFDQGSIATATQVISQHSTLYQTLERHEIILRDVLEELCRIILRLGNQSMSMGLNEEAKITVKFDDSIIEDKTAERLNDRQDLAAGIMNDWEYRMKWYNEDEKTAKDMLPKMDDLVSDSA